MNAKSNDLASYRAGFCLSCLRLVGVIAMTMDSICRSASMFALPLSERWLLACWYASVGGFGLLS